MSLVLSSEMRAAVGEVLREGGEPPLPGAEKPAGKGGD
jgi:hypothetical protein